MTDDVGDTRIDLYLTSVTDDEINGVIEDICNALAARGLANEEDTDMRSILAAKAIEFPDLANEAAMKGFIDSCGRIAIPVAGEATKIAKVPDHGAP